MAVKAFSQLPGHSSSLNPNAPQFIPASFVAVDDFGPTWWHMIQTSPAFRDYWLRERYADSNEALMNEEFEELDVCPEFEIDWEEEEEAFEELQRELEEEANISGYCKTEGSLKESKFTDLVQLCNSIEQHKAEKAPKLVQMTVKMEKAPQHVNRPRPTSHRIQQPRA
eukprot:jgi/Mesen1/4574/ME000232S03832